MIGEFIQRHPTFGDFIEALRLRYRAWKRGLPEIPHDGDSTSFEDRAVYHTEPIPEDQWWHDLKSWATFKYDRKTKTYG